MLSTSSQTLPKRKPTLADLEALPEGVNGEIIRGELVVSPRPAAPHAIASSALGSLLSPFGLGPRGPGPGGWWILDEPELHLPVDPETPVIIPDLAGWRRERMPVLKGAYFTQSPDWICEVLSPSNAARDRSDKMWFYAQAGVAHAWLVDPILETVEVYQLDGPTWRLLGAKRGEALVRLEPFDAIELELGALWDRGPQP